MSTILVPLYIYPSCAGAGWAPLFSALETALDRNPALEFLVVINPGNGPGPDYPIPNADYQVALSKLSSYNNVKVIGYVHCSYGQRELELIQKDVNDYLAWLEFAERGEWVSYPLSFFLSFRLAVFVVFFWPFSSSGLADLLIRILRPGWSQSQPQTRGAIEMQSLAS
ncbi:Spherulation-specific family 4-domain-containing protein [Sordaria brevicollis]|uniref:Spherulation-specific family 4-domain-containing protein n=1 Tax=Sordaria brevicollis TaxID=83679 RepID=A0AAE0UEP3_SORBR|nr:Spherulation-specific family 4-domain-containing protein [Sordaria brevicollis]